MWLQEKVRNLKINLFLGVIGTSHQTQTAVKDLAQLVSDGDAFD